MPEARMMNSAILYDVPTQDGGALTLTVTQPHDPAYQLLMDPNVFSTPTVYRDGCYICRDPEFSQMGLPLCRFCEGCKIGHVPADDTECDDCGADAQELYYKQMAEQCALEGHQWKFHPTLTVPMWTRWDKDGKTSSPEDHTYPAYTSCERCREGTPNVDF